MFYVCFAVEIYTNGKRKAGEDIDILVAPSDIEILAKKFNSQVKRRYFKKENFWVDDFGFEVNLERLKIEVSGGFPKLRVNNGSIYKVFQRRVYRSYQGLNIWVEPIEELIAHKAAMFREKDIRDLKILDRGRIDYNLLREFAKDYGKYHYMKIIRNLKNLGIL